MNLSNLAIITSIVASLVSVPFLSMSISENNNLELGSAALGMDENFVNISPKKSSRIWNSESFEKTFQTAFGEVKISIESDKISQELIEPDKRIVVTETPYETIWVLYTQNWILNISKTAEKIVDSFSSPAGTLKVVKEKGGISDYFEGVSETNVREDYSTAKEVLKEGVERLEEAKNQIELPTTVTCDPKNIAITKIKPEDNEWVKIENPNDCPINITNWTLSDTSDTNTFNFPEFILDPNAWVKVYSSYSDCTESDTDLCWKSTGLWNNDGDTAFLRNSNGSSIDTCSYTGEDIVDGIVDCTG